MHRLIYTRYSQLCIRKNQIIRCIFHEFALEELSFKKKIARKQEKGKKERIKWWKSVGCIKGKMQAIKLNYLVILDCCGVQLLEMHNACCFASIYCSIIKNISLSQKIDSLQNENIKPFNWFQINSKLHQKFTDFFLTRCTHSSWIMIFCTWFVYTEKIKKKNKTKITIFHEKRIENVTTMWRDNDELVRSTNAVQIINMDWNSNRETMLNKDLYTAAAQRVSVVCTLKKLFFRLLSAIARVMKPNSFRFFSLLLYLPYLFSDYVNRIKTVENDHVKIEISFHSNAETAAYD